MDACVLAAMNLGARDNSQRKPNLVGLHSSGRFPVSMLSDSESSPHALHAPLIAAKGMTLKALVCEPINSLYIKTAGCGFQTEDLQK